jgi:hypothetical protein
MRKSTLLPKSNVILDHCLLRGDVINLCADSFVLQVRHSKTNKFGQRVMQVPFFCCENYDVSGSGIVVTFCLVTLAYFGYSFFVP